MALTRAEERLYIGGALGTRDRNGPAEESWYTAVEKALSGLGADWEESRRAEAALKAHRRDVFASGYVPAAAVLFRVH